MDKDVDFYLERALAPSTKRTYGSAKRRYLSFCITHDISPLPTSESLLCRYVAQLANDNLSHTSIKCYLAAIRHLQIEQGLGDPTISAMAKLELVIRGVKRVQAEKQPARTRLPITIDILEKLHGSWRNHPNRRDSTMLWAASALCFFGFLRSGEITVPSDSAFDEASHLTFKDVAVDRLDNPSILRVNIKVSKTDPFRQGVNVCVGRSGCPLCPVVAMLDYLVARGGGPGPLFQFADGRPLTRTRLVEQVRTALSKAGIESTKYSGHSFRSGAATTAAHHGISDATIKMLGRWKSNAYQLYIKTPREQLAAITKKLVKK